MRPRRSRRWIWLVAVPLLLGLYFVPPVHDRLKWRVEDLRTRLFYILNPPEAALFVPGRPVDVTAIYGTTRAQYMQTLTPAVSNTPRPGPTGRPTSTSTPPPPAVTLPGVIYVDQHERWNYCGPANLAMALNFWGWEGDRDDIAEVVKPGSNDARDDFIQRGFADKNVMPYELVDFVNEQTELRAILRYGGDERLLKGLIAAGFPVVAEKGYYERDYTGKVDWLGHYLFTTGYDDSRGGFIVQDAWLQPGKNLLSDYEIYLEGWRSFDYLFFVVYPPAREAELLALLGPWADQEWAKQHALEVAEAETNSLTEIDLFFAWFNKGTSHVSLLQYHDAAAAYDQAFTLYAGLGDEERRPPYRIMWYQTGPYFAYYYAGRYQDVINLANTTLNETISEPTLEESLLWRGRAYAALGNTQAAIADYRAALAIHVNWPPAEQGLVDLGVQP